jgi:hypothetical protein
VDEERKSGWGKTNKQHQKKTSEKRRNQQRKQQSKMRITSPPTSEHFAAAHRYQALVSAAEDVLDDLTDDYGAALSGYPTPREEQHSSSLRDYQELEMGKKTSASTSHEEIFLFPSVFNSASNNNNDSSMEGVEEEEDAACIDDISDVCTENRSSGDESEGRENEPIDEEDGAAVIYASCDSALPNTLNNANTKPTALSPSSAMEGDEIIVEEPTNSSMASKHFDEIRASLDQTNGHPYLDIYEQRAMVHQHYNDMRSQFVCTASDSISYPNLEDRHTSAKILVHEAHRLQHHRILRKMKLGLAPTMEVDDCGVMWKRIGNSVARDLAVEDHGFVQRRLSCMCIFNPLKAERHYSDNDVDRMLRVCRQEKVLEQLHRQMRNGGNAYFLETDSAHQQPCTLLTM